MKAPSFSQCIFCAPMATLEPLAASICGRQIDERRADDDFVARVVRRPGAENRGRIREVWSGVLYIFQLAAISFLRGMSPF